MTKIYRVIVAGVILDHAIKYSENIIEKNKDAALNKISSKFQNVWSSSVELNLKETVKVNILNLLNLESITLEVRKRRICKNCKHFSKKNKECIYHNWIENTEPYKKACGGFDTEKKKKLWRNLKSWLYALKTK